MDRRGCGVETEDRRGYRGSEMGREGECGGAALRWREGRRPPPRGSQEPRGDRGPEREGDRKEAGSLGATEQREVDTGAVVTEPDGGEMGQDETQDGGHGGDSENRQKTEVGSELGGVKLGGGDRSGAGTCH